MTALTRPGSAKTVPAKDGDVLLGEDWVSPETLGDEALRADRGRRGIVSLNRSPLARGDTFNIIHSQLIFCRSITVNATGCKFEPGSCSRAPRRQKRAIQTTRVHASIPPPPTV